MPAIALVELGERTGWIRVPVPAEALQARLSGLPAGVLVEPPGRQVADSRPIRGERRKGEILITVDGALDWRARRRDRRGATAARVRPSSRWPFCWR